MSFEDKVILVTGASSGIGADAAKHFAKLGGKVALVGRNEELLDEVVNAIVEAGSPEPLKIVADVTVDAERIINETIEHFGQLDVLVNNAGFGKKQSIMESSMEFYDEIMATNTRAVVELTKLAAPHLETTKGNIVNVSSIAGIIAIKNMPFYNMTKAALDQFTACAALEFGPKGVRVNSVNPGAIRTPMFEKVGLSEEEMDGLMAAFEGLYPVGRIGEVADTSAAIAFLASDSASFITGVLLRVDGGAVNAGAY